VLPLAPDMLHKENLSGGPPYGVILPDGSADGLFAGETTTPFVSYLNWVFRNGGFPWPAASDNPVPLLTWMASARFHPSGAGDGLPGYGRARVAGTGARLSSGRWRSDAGVVCYLLTGGLQRLGIQCLVGYIVGEVCLDVGLPHL
jgi:hypothetical protein